MTEAPLFSLNDVCFNYGKTRVLDHISLDMSAGHFFGIVGPNGCGKTTLLDLLIGCKTPSHGTLSFLGKSIGELSKNYLARQIALVPQEFDTGFGFTVEEIVLMGRHPYINRFSSASELDWQLIDRAITNIGIENLRSRYTNTLSGGQKQRVIVARALAQDTPVLLFDEATSSLDIQFTLQIFNHARELVRRQKKTVVAVIHDLNLAAAYCDQLIFMKDGTIFTYGQIEQTLTVDTISSIFGVTANIDSNTFNNSLQISFQYGEK